ncbi:lysylphosphatidylglycerol synthase domain-containing protein [Shewanella sp. Scap07]|uniref:lysylphosphatidylglycerol synthase domain-containing protein n=1 Tax=Shewanella sp. Scap07 TaxID=2589987 RepID=UPI0015BCDD5E|nr:lysylphosphatidylglycerol synthase domain-containing protein [Shewanella sp. Scap07]
MYKRQHKIGIKIFLADRFTDLLSVCFLALITLIFVSRLSILHVGIALTFLLSLMVLFLFNRLKFKALIESKFVNYEFSFDYWGRAIVLGCFVWCLPAVFMAILLDSSDTYNKVVSSIFANSIAIISGLFSILPAGFGTFEAAIIHSMKTLGFSLEGVLHSLLYMRIMFVGGSTVLGLLAISIIQFFYKNFNEEHSTT